MRRGVRWSARHGMLLALALLAVPLVAGVAWADTIGPDCTNNTCQGLFVTLTYDNLSAPDTTQTLDLTLTIDATGIVGGDTLFGASIRDVGAKITPNTDDVVSATLTDAPGGVANWTTVVGGLNAGGCFAGKAGFICSHDSDLAPIPGLYSWTWSVEIESGTLLTDPFEASVKARFCVPGSNCESNDGNRVGDLLSENITLQVPEPSALLLLSSGLLGLGLVRRVATHRRRK